MVDIKPLSNFDEEDLTRVSGGPQGQQENSMSHVFVIDQDKRPLTTIHPADARHLLKRGEASVFRRFPFTLILKQRMPAVVVQPLRIKIDPGSKTTGIALLNDATGQVMWAAELTHRGQQVKAKLDDRRAQRHGRRSRHTRYRAPRFANRTRPKGWLPPSLHSRIQNVLTWVARLQRYAPITNLTQELVRFDMQLMQDAEISGVAYQQGELQGYEIREYLLEKWQRCCVYCGIKNVQLQIEHIMPRARGGTDRVSNLTLACEPCNQRKGTQTATEFGFPEIQAQANAPLKDAAAVNTTLWVRFVCSKPWKREKSSNERGLSLTTDSSMMGVIPIPLGEGRNSILPSVATGPQSEKREEMEIPQKLTLRTAPSKLLWLAKANLRLNRRYREQANVS